MSDQNKITWPTCKTCPCLFKNGAPLLLGNGLDWKVNEYSCKKDPKPVHFVDLPDKSLTSNDIISAHTCSHHPDWNQFVKSVREGSHLPGAPKGYDPFWPYNCICIKMTGHEGYDEKRHNEYVSLKGRPVYALKGCTICHGEGKVDLKPGETLINSTPLERGTVSPSTAFPQSPGPKR